MRDLKPVVDFLNSCRPAARTATVTGTGVDLARKNGAVAHLHVGTVTDGTHTPTLEESDDDTTYTTVAAGDLKGSFAALATNTDQRVGYLGSKRYVRVKVTVSGTTTGGVYGATILRGFAAKQPL